MSSISHCDIWVLLEGPPGVLYVPKAQELAESRLPVFFVMPEPDDTLMLSNRSSHVPAAPNVTLNSMNRKMFNANCRVVVAKTVPSPLMIATWPPGTRCSEICREGPSVKQKNWP